MGALRHGSFWDGEGRRDRRCLLRPEQWHSPGVLPPEFSPPSRMLRHLVGRGPLGDEGMSLERGAKSHSEKGISPREAARVAFTPKHRGWPPIGMGSHGRLQQMGLAVRW